MAGVASVPVGMRDASTTKNERINDEDGKDADSKI